MRHLCTLLLLAFTAIPALTAQTTSLRIVSIDSARIGGLYDFRLSVANEQALREQFGGHDIEIRFDPLWEVIHYPTDSSSGRGIYERSITVVDNTTGQQLARYRMLNAAAPCPVQTQNRLSEDALVFVENDSTHPLADPESLVRQTVAGTFSTEAPCVGDTSLVGGAFSFGFDYALEQWGGSVRPGIVALASGPANTLLTSTSTGLLSATMDGDTALGFNNGPALIDIEFLPGGVDTLSVQFGSTSSLQQQTFVVSYLTMRVRNLISYERPDGAGTTTTVSYPGDIPHTAVSLLSANNTDWPDCQNVPVGTYNLAAFAWVNGRSSDHIFDRARQAATPVQAGGNNTGYPVGMQGRYYLSAISGADTIDFSHVLLYSGMEVVLDYANKRGRKATPFNWSKASVQPTVDFQPGDRVQFSTLGGVLGLPLPGASVLLHVDVETAVGDAPATTAPVVSVSPNPLADHATLRYTLAQPGQTTLDILDAMGRVVATPVDGYQSHGTHTVQIDATPLGSGTYFYRLRTGTVVHSGKLVILR